MLPDTIAGASDAESSDDQQRKTGASADGSPTTEPAGADAWMQRAWRVRREKKLDESAEALAKALELATDSAECNYELGLTLGDQKKTALVSLSKALRHLGKWDDARQSSPRSKR